MNLAGTVGDNRAVKRILSGCLLLEAKEAHSRVGGLKGLGRICQDGQKAMRGFELPARWIDTVDPRTSIIWVP